MIDRAQCLPARARESQLTKGTDKRAVKAPIESKLTSYTNRAQRENAEWPLSLIRWTESL